MQGKEHMDYILNLIRKMTDNPQINSAINPVTKPVIPPTEKTTVITPEEIQRRINERHQNKSG